MIGQKFHRLTIISQAPPTSGNRGKRWVCQCECGNQTIVRNDSLKNGRSKSCGCYSSEKSKERIIKINTSHGMANTPEYKTWTGILNRCNNQKSKSYKDYGGRGIQVCESWKKFENFYKDMGKRPEGTSIDRIDVNGDYCSENCRWATRQIQNNNTRKNKYITHNGETKTLSEWSRVYNIPVWKLSQRMLRDNLSFEEAILSNDRRYKSGLVKA
jgi:hypothetical protein